MKKTFYAALLALCSLSRVYAAGEENFKLDILDTFRNSISFHDVNIMDMRIHKENAGYLRMGPFNKKNDLVTPEGFDVMLQQFAMMTTGQAAEKGPETLLIVVRDFSLADRPIQGELGTFYARLDLFLGQEGRYRRIAHVDSFFETVNAWDVTKNVRRLAARKMTDWLRYAATYTTPDNVRQAAFTTDEIREQLAAEHGAYPVYRESPKEGVYYTLEEFLNNTPGKSEFIQKDYYMDGIRVSYFYEKEEGKKKGKSLDKDVVCYAIYNSKRWYKKTSDGLVEMKFTDNDFYFRDIGTGLKKSDDAAIMFGMVGALIEGSSSRKGNALYRMRLDPVTGTGYCTERLY